jgi:hypothetical protein
MQKLYLVNSQCKVNGSKNELGISCVNSSLNDFVLTQSVEKQKEIRNIKSEDVEEVYGVCLAGIPPRMTSIAEAH